MPILLGTAAWCCFVLPALVTALGGASPRQLILPATALGGLAQGSLSSLSSKVDVCLFSCYTHTKISMIYGPFLNLVSFPFRTFGDAK